MNWISPLAIGVGALPGTWLRRAAGAIGLHAGGSLAMTPFGIWTSHRLAA